MSHREEFPCRSHRICCDIGPDDVSTVEPDDDDAIEQVEANGRNNEQIHGGDVDFVPLDRFPFDCRAFGLNRDSSGRPAANTRSLP